MTMRGSVIRSLVRAPVYSLMVIIVQAVAIASGLASFTALQKMVFKPLPYAHENELVVVEERRGLEKKRVMPVSPANFLDWRAANHVFAGMAAMTELRTNLQQQHAAHEVRLAFVSPNLFDLLGALPCLGEPLQAGDEGVQNRRVAVISYELWTRLFARDSSVLGMAVQLAGRPYNIVGVMPERFRVEGSSAEVWAPLRFSAAIDYRRLGARYLTVLTRLRAGVTPRQAQVDLARIAAILAEKYPDFNAGWSADVTLWRDKLASQSRPVLLIINALVVLLVLTVSTNLAHLQLIRFEEHARATAIRMALGATRLGLASNLVAEAVVLSLCATLLGYFAARFTLATISSRLPAGTPRLADLALDGTSAFLAFGLAVAISAVTVSVPVLRLLALPIRRYLSEGARSSGVVRQFGKVLIASEVAAAFVLIAAAGVMLQSLRRLYATPLGYEPDKIVTFQLNLAGTADGAPDRAPLLFESVANSISHLQGVESVGLASWLPLRTSIPSVQILAASGNQLSDMNGSLTEIQSVSSNYFKAMGIRVLRGAGLSPRKAKSPVEAEVVVGEAFAARFYAGTDPIGQRVRLLLGDTVDAIVAGVVSDVRAVSIDSSPKPILYMSHFQVPALRMDILIRTSRSASQLNPFIKGALAELDPLIPLGAATSLSRTVDEHTANRRMTAAVLLVFGSLSLILTVLGVYGIVRYSVSQRRHEFGIRSALGASPADIMRLVTLETLRSMGMGLIAGAGLAAVVLPLLRTAAYRTSVFDALTLVSSAAITLTLGVLAAARPASAVTTDIPHSILRAS